MNVLVLCSAMAVACGDDDSASMKSDAGTESVADATVAPSPDAASDSHNGTGGVISSSGTGGTSVPEMRIPCGQNSCAPNPLGLTACCADQKAGICGTMMGSSCSTGPTVDPSCPSVMIPVAGKVGSCCADNGMCGLDGSLFAMGCVDYRSLTSSLGVLGGVLTLPPEQSCGESEGDAGPGEDAGH